MANEGTAVFQLTVTKGNFSDTRSINHNFDVTGTYSASGVQNIGTTQELIAIGSDVATLGYATIRNLDVTNYVQLGLVVSATFYPFAKLKPGEACQLRLGMAY